MAKYNVTQDVRVDIRVSGENVTLELRKGDVELDDHVAALLVAEGLATVAGPKQPKKQTVPDTEPLEQI